MNPIDRIPMHTNPFDGIRRVDADGSEWWSARDLMPLMGYTNWRQFTEAIDRAKATAVNTGADVAELFEVNLEKSGGRPAENYRLTRYAAYLTAMNGDPRKPEIARAQTYFAVKTREAELVEQQAAFDPTDLDHVDQLARAAGAAVALARQERSLRLVAETKVTELEPAANAWTVLASGDGDYAVADAAKILSRDPNIKLGRDRLFTLLREYGWLYRQQGDTRHRAYQTAVDNGRLSELPSSHYHPRTGVLVLDPPQVRVTLKGLQELHRRLEGASPLQLFGPSGDAA